VIGSRLAAAKRRLFEMSLALAAEGSSILSRAPRKWYAERLLNSSLFDTEHYAMQAGIEPSASRCIEHFLMKGMAAGYQANRLFDGAAYLHRHADVAAAQFDPFLHFVVHGLTEGRHTSAPASYLEQIAAMDAGMLASRRILTQAQASGWSRQRPSIWRNRTVAVYASSLGNFFFRHIADRVADGLRGVGACVHRLDQNGLRPATVATDFIVAPHEFFFLGAGRDWRAAHASRRVIVLNTEQPGTPWYFRALTAVRPTDTILDLSPQSSVVLHDLGWKRSGYFPIGPASFRHGDAQLERYVDPEPPATDEPLRTQKLAWRDRSIDILFMGTLTSRRSEALGRLAPTLAKYRCVIHAPTGGGRPLLGQGGEIGIGESLGLARNARILLNIHRDDLAYFEWHRIMMLGLEQGAVVVTEPSLPSPGLEPTRHFQLATIAEMSAKLQQMLDTPAGEAFAADVAHGLTRELNQRFDLAVELNALAFLHDGGFAHG
jgi:hypothetical protein